MKLRTTTLWLALLASAACGGRNQAAPAPTPAPEPVAAEASPSLEPAPPLPVDERIRVGTLENGLTYYVLEHQQPRQRAQLWLAVDTGSVLEDDDQRGLAHFVEHMAFNGTEQFEKMAIVDYLESIGMKFGPDVNAYTSFDETVYMLQVPTEDGAIVDKGFDILREWAGRVSFDPVEVDKERGVVLEEWRLGRGAWKRIADQQYPVLFHGSRYAERLPIGSAEIIQNAPRDALLRYYRDWYRPDLMAVIAVGDFDADEIEARIRERFGDLEQPASPRDRQPVATPPHDQPLVSIATDPEMPYTLLRIVDKMPHRPERSADDYRRLVLERLYHEMVRGRFDEIQSRPDAPIVSGSSFTGSLSRTADAFYRTAVVKDGQLDAALTTLVEETERVGRHGFTATELERAKKRVLRDYQQSVRERDKRDGRSFAGEILRHFLEDEMMPGVEAELELVQRFLPTIELGELNGLARAWSDGASRVLLVSGPGSLEAPSPDALLARMREVQGRELAAYVDESSDAPLLGVEATPGSITDTRTLPEVGVTEWTLSNGARVVFKTTDFKNDEIHFAASSPGGHSLVPDARFEAARHAAAIVSEGGVGEHDAVSLRKALAGVVAEVRPYIHELEEGMHGSASPEDLETLLQLVHMYFVAPNADADAFAAWKARQTEWVRNRRLSPESSFFEDMGTVQAQNHRRRRPVTPESLEEVTLDDALAVYADRFADASDFTFTFVGNVDEATLRPLVETYLAGLPAPKRGERWRDVGVKSPKGVVKKTVRRGTEPKSYVYLTFHGPAKWSRDAENDLRMLTEVLSIRLREVLREDMSGVYGAQVWGGMSRRPREERSVAVFFGCAPENVEALTAAVFAELDALRKNGIGDDYIAKIREQRRRQRELDLRDNRFWVDELQRAYRFGDDPRQILDGASLIEKVSSSRVRAAARRYARKGRYLLGVLRPEVAAAPAADAADAETSGVADARATDAPSGERRVARADLEARFADGSAWARDARLVPALRDGAAIGFKIYAIRPGSLYQELGLANGDLIRRINGISLASPDQALEAYAKLRDASSYRIDIERRGKPMTLRVRVE